MSKCCRLRAGHSLEVGRAQRPGSDHDPRHHGDPRRHDDPRQDDDDPGADDDHDPRAHDDDPRADDDPRQPRMGSDPRHPVTAGRKRTDRVTVCVHMHIYIHIIDGQPKGGKITSSHTILHCLFVLCMYLCIGRYVGR